MHIIGTCIVAFLVINVFYKGQPTDSVLLSSLKKSFFYLFDKLLYIFTIKTHQFNCYLTIKKDIDQVNYHHYCMGLYYNAWNSLQ